MARVVARAYQKERSSTRMGVTEWIVVIAACAGLFFAGRYYFEYRHGPAYALSSFIGAIKAGSPKRQYALIDDDDKQNKWPTLDEYAKMATWAHGYTERITDARQSEVKIDPKRPTIAKIDVVVTIRDISQGKELYQVSTHTYNDNYTLHKDKNGDWKIWITHSKMNMLQAEPSPPTTNIMDG